MTLLTFAITWHREFALAMRWLSVLGMVWMVVSYVRQRPLSRRFYLLIVIAELLIALQMGIGVYLLAGVNLRPANLILHLLYGVLSLITFPIIVHYTRKEGDAMRVILVWLFGFLFMFGLSFRTVLSGMQQ